MINKPKPFFNVVAALIIKDDRILICQRPANKSNALLWEFVGGKVESDETKEEALIRECREELDADIEVGEIFMELDHEYPDILVHLTLFRAFLVSENIKVLEHNDVSWILPSEVDQYEFCPADTVILKKIKEIYVRRNEQ